MQPTGAYIAYTRCSTEEQQKKGNSHEYQLSGLRRSGAVRIGNLYEAAAYSDTVSGTRFDNRINGLDAAYKVCDRQRGSVQYLFVYRWDRLGRDVSDCFQCIKKFRAVGVEVNCPDEWIDFTDPSYPLILSVKFGMAQSESMRISDRTKDGVNQAQMSGYHTAHAPIGYRKGEPRDIGGKKRRVCEIDPISADTLHRCFERYAAGENKVELWKEYRSILKVQKSQFCRMFHNPFYCGLIYVKAHRGNPAQLVPGKHLPIISRELYDRCQQVQEVSEHPTKGKTWSAQADTTGDFYLKGVLRCPLTGRNMTAYRAKGKSGRRFPYYASQGKGGIVIPAGKAHGLINLALAGMRIDEDQFSDIRKEINRQLSERIERANQEADAAIKAIAKTTTRLNNIRKDYADGALSAYEYREVKRTFDSDLIAHETELVASQREQAQNSSIFLQVLNLLSGIDTVFAASTPEYKNRILRAVFPEGVFIDKEAHKVRTPCVNQIITELCSKSISCAVLEIENGTASYDRPVMGARGDRYRTHLQALQNLFAA